MTKQAAPLVSIIVPVYNAQHYLHYCIDSILTQSYRRLEIVLIDDGSTDDSPAMCDAYASKDPRITVIHQDNGGIAAAQNAGLDASTGDYIAFADNDDILDRRNIEFLLHALLATGADMSKARWQQFGVCQLDSVAREAAQGESDPEKLTMLGKPLHAYQTVFCKSLRVAGELLGLRTEAKYFNEANWCRLYRRELWDGIRFPEGRYAQDVMVAGELYARMALVADIDLVLYHWLQSPKSVTHAQRSFAFYHDNVAAGVKNFRLALEHGITPMRSYYTMMGSYAEERQALRHGEANEADEASAARDVDMAAQTVLASDAKEIQSELNRLTPIQRAGCEVTRRIRLLEKQVYDLSLKRLR